MSSRSDRKGTAVINIVSSGDNEIIAAPTTGHIEIDHISFTTAGSVLVTYKDGSTAKTGAMSFGVDGSWAFDRSTVETAPIECSAGNAFKINLSAGVQVSGIVCYRVVGG